MAKLRPQTPPSEFYQLLDQIMKNEKSTKEAFEKAVSLAREQGFTDTEIAMFMHDYLKDKIPKTTLGRWIKPLKPEQIDNSSISNEVHSDLKAPKKELEQTSTIDGKLAHPQGAGQSPVEPKEQDLGSSGSEEQDKPEIVWKPDEKDTEVLRTELNNALIYIKKLEAINKTQKEIKPETDKHDCTQHSMYLKAQAIIETERKEKERLKQRVEELDKVVFVPADKAESPPDIFQVPKDIITGGGYHEKLSPIQAVGKIRQLLNSVTSLEIGWKVIE